MFQGIKTLTRTSRIILKTGQVPKKKLPGLATSFKLAYGCGKSRFRTWDATTFNRTLYQLS